MRRSGCSAARRSSSRATAPTWSGWRSSRSFVFHHSFFVKFKPNNVNANELNNGTTLGVKCCGSGAETEYDLFDLKTCIIFIKLYYIGYPIHISLEKFNYCISLPAALLCTLKIVNYLFGLVFRGETDPDPKCPDT
jgi:hypothetical protein